MNKSLNNLIKESQNFRESNVDMEWDTFVKDRLKCNCENEIHPVSKKKFSKNTQLWTYFSAAASFILLLSFGINWWISQEDEPEYITEVTVSESEFVELSDGSTIVLDPNSSVTFPNSFEDKEERRIILEGTAVFDISPNDSKPFIVVQEGLGVKVLGTIFKVKKTGDNSVEIENIEGQIKFYEISNEDDGFIMNQGDRMKYDENGFGVLPSRNSQKITVLDLIEHLMMKYDSKIYPKAYMDITEDAFININLDQELGDLLENIQEHMDFQYRSLPCVDCYEITKAVVL